MGDAVTPDLPEPASRTPRVWPDEPLPPYRYVPLGRFPHPTMDPGGHLREGGAEVPLDAPMERAWMTNRFWLFGIDLFNHWYFWEATEMWEKLWKRMDKESPDAIFMQAMMMSAGAILKAQCSEPLGITAFWQGAESRFERIVSLKRGFRATFWGLPVKKTYKGFRTYFAPGADAARPLRQDDVIPRLTPRF